MQKQSDKTETINKEWFLEFDEHLTKDKKPSDYFQKLVDDNRFPMHHPFGWLMKLEHVEQNPKFHPEGSVWNHTMLVVDNAAKHKHRSRNARALMWAALLHDLGKIPATKVRKGRITAYDHDKMGRGMAKEFLMLCGCDGEFVERVCALVRWHMQSLFVLRNLPFANLRSMTEEVDIGEIGLLALSDRLGRGQASRQEEDIEYDNVLQFMKKSKDYATRHGIKLPNP